MRRVVWTMLVGGLLLKVPVALAHHSFAAIYDFTKPVTVTGVVSLVEWTNPHARIYIDVKNDTAPWTVHQTMHYLPDSELIEHICEENNKFQEQLGGGPQP